MNPGHVWKTHVKNLVLTLVFMIHVCPAHARARLPNLPAGYPPTARRKTCINMGWQYHLGDVPDAQYQNYDCSTWETVCVPHTLKLASLALDKCENDKTQPTFHRDIAWYRRPIQVYKNPGKVFLEFEGAHQV